MNSKCELQKRVQRHLKLKLTLCVRREIKVNDQELKQMSIDNFNLKFIFELQLTIIYK